MQFPLVLVSKVKEESGWHEVQSSAVSPKQLRQFISQNLQSPSSAKYVPLWHVRQSIVPVPSQVAQDASHYMQVPKLFTKPL